MYQLKRAHLVQFFLFQAETLELDATTAIIAPNGAGKSALLDALQIVMLGADRNQIRFNAQAGGSHRQDQRTDKTSNHQVPPPCAIGSRWCEAQASTCERYAIRIQDVRTDDD